MKTTLKSIRDRVTGSSNVKWTVSQASQLNMVDPGNCFLVEMLVFTAESKADFSFFYITPGRQQMEEIRKLGLEKRVGEYSALWAPESILSGERLSIQDLIPVLF